MSMTTLPAGWTSTGEGLATNPHPLLGGIIDREIVSGKWFAIFHADIEIISDLDSREEAFREHQKAIEAKRAESPAKPHGCSPWLGRGGNLGCCIYCGQAA